MTARKHLKQLVRSRMARTGESYAAARRHIVQEAPAARVDPAARWHMPGSVPAAAALRILLANAGIQNPLARKPFSEPMVFGIAGGIGIGVFQFFYEKENFASFFVAGRHSWHDDAAYLTRACERFKIKPHVQESSGTKTAEKQLREALKDHGPCIAWVDAASLPHRGMPSAMSGSGYHVLTVYKIDDATGQALVGDLSDEPISISLEALAEARARIKKQKNRLLSIEAADGPQELRPLVREGLAACHRGLKGGGPKAAPGNFTLEVLKTWAERLHGSKDKDSWQRIFTPGPRLWRGLTSIYDFIEHYGTGGGLCRPIFADFLSEAGESLDDSNLRSLAQHYAALGQQWSDLAQAALPATIPACQEVRELLERRVEILASGAREEKVREAWSSIEQMEQACRDGSPFTERNSEEIRKDLRGRVLEIYSAECTALEALARTIA